jgi:hypothetical protein
VRGRSRGRGSTYGGVEPADQARGTQRLGEAAIDARVEEEPG